MRFTTILGAAILMAMAGPTLAQDCLEWGAPAELSGILVEGVYPGPPEFESVSGGDEAYSAIMLHLKTPICVTANTETGEEALASTDLVQLACDENQLAQLVRGDRVSMAGRLFSAHTGYHVTPALFQCP